MNCKPLHGQLEGSAAAVGVALLLLLILRTFRLVQTPSPIPANLPQSRAMSKI